MSAVLQIQLTLRLKSQQIFIVQNGVIGKVRTLVTQLTQTLLLVKYNVWTIFIKYYLVSPNDILYIW